MFTKSFMMLLASCCTIKFVVIIGALKSSIGATRDGCLVRLGFGASNSLGSSPEGSRGPCRINSNGSCTTEDDVRSVVADDGVWIGASNSSGSSPEGSVGPAGLTPMVVVQQKLVWWSGLLVVMLLDDVRT